MWCVERQRGGVLVERYSDPSCLTDTRPRAVICLSSLWHRMRDERNCSSAPFTKCQAEHFLNLTISVTHAVFFFFFCPLYLFYHFFSALFPDLLSCFNSQIWSLSVAVELKLVKHEFTLIKWCVRSVRKSGWHFWWFFCVSKRGGVTVLDLWAHKCN